MRAVEQGLPVVRSANTGISAIIDGYGRILGELGLGQKGVLDGNLPRPIAPTLVSRFEGRVEIAVLLLALLCWLAFSLQMTRCITTR